MQRSDFYLTVTDKLVLSVACLVFIIGFVNLNHHGKWPERHPRKETH